MPYIAGYHIAEEARVSVRGGVAEYIQQVHTVYDHYISADILTGEYIVRILYGINNPAARVGDYNGMTRRAETGLVYVLNDKGEVRSRLDVTVDDIGEVDVADRIAVAEDDNILGAARNEVHNAEQSLKARAVKLPHALCVICGDEGGQYLYAARAARKVPVLSRADMVEQRLVVVVGYHSDLRYAGVYHI